MTEGLLSLADFEGAWQVDRRIEDRLAGQAARFEGTAVFTWDGPGLHYREEGTLHLPGAQPMAATRDYLWRQEGDDIAVFFPDGRRFHRIGVEQSRDTHWCDPDTYRVAYGFADWPLWSAVWTVSGPRKDYTMTSAFCRA